MGTGASERRELTTAPCTNWPNCVCVFEGAAKENARDKANRIEGSQRANGLPAIYRQDQALHTHTIGVSTSGLWMWPQDLGGLVHWHLDLTGAGLDPHLTPVMSQDIQVSLDGGSRQGWDCRRVAPRHAATAPPFSDFPLPAVQTTSRRLPSPAAGQCSKQEIPSFVPLTILTIIILPNPLLMHLTDP